MNIVPELLLVYVTKSSSCTVPGYSMNLLVRSAQRGMSLLLGASMDRFRSCACVSCLCPLRVQGTSSDAEVPPTPFESFIAWAGALTAAPHGLSGSGSESLTFRCLLCTTSVHGKEDQSWHMLFP